MKTLRVTRATGLTIQHSYPAFNVIVLNAAHELRRILAQSCKVRSREVKSDLMSEVAMQESFMREALLEAKRSAERKEVPVGAVVVSDKKILSRAHNKTIDLNDPTAHAEILAIRKACGIKNNYRIPDCDLYVTLEPCAMCMGAILQARIRRLIFGAVDPKSGAVQSIMTFPIERMNHPLEIESGILAEECGKILKDFFVNKR